MAGLDRFFLGEDYAHLRVFWRIARDDTDPGLERRALDDRCLVDIVGAHPGFHHTAMIYRSEIWEGILGPQPMSLIRRRELLDVVLARLNLFEPNSQDWMAAEELKLGAFGVRRHSLRDFNRWLSHFSRKRDIDHLVLLSLLFRRAIEATALEEAIALQNALIGSVRRFCRRPGFTNSIASEWEFLLRRRVIAGQQSLAIPQHLMDEAGSMLSGWASRCKTPAQQQRHQEVLWAGACLLDNQQEPRITHLVPRTPEVNDYQRKRQELVDRAHGTISERILQEHNASLDDGVTAYVRFKEMRGYREPMRDWD